MQLPIAQDQDQTLAGPWTHRTIDWMTSRWPKKKKKQKETRICHNVQQVLALDFHPLHKMWSTVEIVQWKLPRMEGRTSNIIAVYFIF